MKQIIRVGYMGFVALGLALASSPSIAKAKPKGVCAVANLHAIRADAEESSAESLTRLNMPRYQRDLSESQIQEGVARMRKATAELVISYKENCSKGDILNIPDTWDSLVAEFCDYGKAIRNTTSGISCVMK